MNEVMERLDIENMIYEIRGQQVMLDSDLARLYQVETKRINEAVKNNMEKFPERFSWILTKEEYQNLRSKFSTSSSKPSYGGRRYLVRVFTEQGVAMLATILKSKTATKISIEIMDAFVKLRKYVSSTLIEQKFINELVIKDNKRIDLLEETFSKLEEKKKTNEIYFEGQIYDAYSKLLDIMIEAKERLIIIDRYADKVILDIISRLKIPVILIAKQNGVLKALDIKKYQEQYHNLKVVYDDSFHDRYLIIDETKIYHCGASINYAGSRTFSINLLEDEIVKKLLLERLMNLINE